MVDTRKGLDSSILLSSAKRDAASAAFFPTEVKNGLNSLATSFGS